METLWKCLVLIIFFGLAQGWGNKEKIKLRDVQVLTLRHGRMTNGRRSSPVPQVKCVGGTAGCHAFVPQVVQCYNRGSDGYDVQWECKADMDNKYRFGEVAVSCEGYDYPDDPYILKGSCGLEYTIDYVGGNNEQSYDSRYDSGHQQNYHGNHDYSGKRHRKSSGWMSTFIMWGIIAFIVYYIWTTLSTNQNTTDNAQSAHQSSSTSPPPPPGFRPEYTQGHTEHPQASSASTDGSSEYGGFWTGMGLGSIAGYLFGNRGHGNTGYYRHHGTPYYSQGGNGWFGGGNWFGGNHGNTGWFGSNHGNTGWFGGNHGNTGWFGGNHGNTGWFGGNHGNTGWFGNGSGSSSSGSFASTHRRSGSSSSSSGSRTASGFGGTKRR